MTNPEKRNKDMIKRWEFNFGLRPEDALGSNNVWKRKGKIRTKKKRDIGLGDSKVDYE